MSRAWGTAILTMVALLCFAANSVLCRLALGGHAIDPASFTTIRLAAGALALAATRGTRERTGPRRSSWPAALMLFAYAAAFSFAYLSLNAGTGALILFGSVQTTMLLMAVRSGERFRGMEAIGLALAMAGLVTLVFPGLSAPDARGSALMALAGIAWGLYSLRGRGSTDPLGDTARSFAWALAPAAVISALSVRHAHASTSAISLALISGAVTSGAGYVIWYRALRRLSAIRAATVQLAVPAIAALAGVLLLGEHPTLRLVAAALLILGGIGLGVTRRSRIVHEAETVKT